MGGVTPAAQARFADPDLTASGEQRASVVLSGLRTLWFNTGTLCNITCDRCYIESSPHNDRLSYLSRDEVAAFLDEARSLHPELREVAFTGGEPFMNRELTGMMRDVLVGGWRVLVLTNAMRPMQHRLGDLAGLQRDFPGRMTLRVSLDHWRPERHEALRGANSWAPAIEGLQSLARLGIDVAVAGRTIWAEDQASLRSGYGSLFASLGLNLACEDPTRLVLFPEMGCRPDVPEITDRCWSILGKSPAEMMCASARMVIKRKGAARPAVISCTLLPYDEAFELGPTLANASGTVRLNHRHCAEFCVLGGGSCSPA